MTTEQPSKALHISLWVAQALLAVMFLMAGFNKLFQSIEELSKMLPWAAEMPAAMVRFIGISEILGGLGLLLPSALRIMPRLTPVAAGGLALVMVLASAFHVSRGEASVIPMNLVLMAVAFFIVWGRSKKAPILAR